MKTRNEISCENIQELLLDQSTENLDQRIIRHIEKCDDCRKFQMTLTTISRSARISPEENLTPDPRIIATLRRSFRKKTTTDNPLESLLALFQKRIPVYQIMLAVFISATLYFSLTKMGLFQADTKRNNLVSQSGKEVIHPAEFPVIQLEQDRQMGKSLSEDSLLAKFRVSIL
jgi:hypothetical protein